MKNLIGNQWLDASDGGIITVTNPATGQVIDCVPESTQKDCDAAVSIAKKAQKTWSKKSIVERTKLLMKFVSLVEEQKDELAKLLSDETGKTITESYNEIENISIAVPAFCEKAKHEYGTIIPSGQEIGKENTLQYVTQVPIGVVVTILPFDFPSDTFCHKVIPALLMGNAVIIKPSPHNPLTITKYAEILLEAGIDEGVVNVINGSDGTAAQILASNPNVGLVSLSGTTKSGKEIMKVCSQNVTKVILELSGNDPFILDRDGNVDLAVEETILGRLYNAGQASYAPKRFLIHNSVKKEYIKKLKQSLAEIKTGMPNDPTVELGCLINEEAAIKVEEQVNKTIAKGAKIICGGKRHGAFYDATIIDDVTKTMDIAKDMEVLGPIIPIIGFDDINEAIKIANQSSYGLSSSIITKDINNALKIANQLECGTTVINGSSMNHSFEIPFGGWKHSGIGNEGIMTSLNTMSRTKTVILKDILK